MAAPPGDEELLQLMRRGDAQAFETLYDRFQGGVYRYALRMTGSESVAEDTTQEVFLSLIQDHSDYRASKGTLKQYLYGMARHRLLRRLQRERTFVSFGMNADGEAKADDLPSNDDPFLDLAREETVGLVRQAILSLPEHFREVVVLCHLQEMSYAEAAQIIQCPVGTVRSRLARARVVLTNKLEDLHGKEVSQASLNVEPAI